MEKLADGSLDHSMFAQTYGIEPRMDLLETMPAEIGALESYRKKDKANLEWSLLVMANLKKANLRWVNLKWADLEGANLEGANLKWVNLEGAHLEGAHLEGANLKWVNLEGAHLEGANLRRANLRRGLGRFVFAQRVRGFRAAGPGSVPAKRQIYPSRVRPRGVSGPIEMEIRQPDGQKGLQAAVRVCHPRGCLLNGWSCVPRPPGSIVVVDYDAIDNIRLLVASPN